MNYSEEFILKVNEIYHDVEASEYENKHPEIFQDEVKRWQEIGKKYFKNNFNKITLLDIGSGTGFVPMQIAKYLKEEDIIICSEIAANILEVCKKNISKEKIICNFQFLKIDGKHYNIETKTVDYVTINSVLHHMPNLLTFFKEIDSLLKVNGKLIVGHEPNIKFFKHVFLWFNYRLINLIIHPREFLITILKFFRLIDLVKGILKFISGKEIIYNKKVVDEVNERLLKEQLIKTPLTTNQIARIVDFHSPIAAGVDRSKGIDIKEILKKYLPNYEIEYLETYKHLCRLNISNKFLQRYNEYLQKRFPKHGSLFLVVFKKIA